MMRKTYLAVLAFLLVAGALAASSLAQVQLRGVGRLEGTARAQGSGSAASPTPTPTPGGTPTPTPTPTPPPPGVIPVEFATYNVQGGGCQGTDNASADIENCPRSASVMFNRPNLKVIAINECGATPANNSCAGRFRDALSDHYGNGTWQVVNANGDSPGGRNAVLLAPDVTFISKDPTVTYTRQSGDNKHSYTHFIVEIEGRTTHVWITRLSTSASVQLRQIDQLLDNVELIADPAFKVVLGDLNSKGNSPADATYATYQEMLNRGFTNGWAAAVAIGTATSHAENPQGLTRSNRIDHVFVRNVAVVSADTPDTRIPPLAPVGQKGVGVIQFVNAWLDRGVRPSDHEATMATLGY